MSEYLEDEEDLITQQEMGFIPPDDGGAEWCLTKIREADAEYKTMTEHYKRQEELARKKHDSDVLRLQGMLQKYLAKMEQAGVAKRTKTQVSYQLPTGTLIRKAGGTDYQRDKDTLLEWLKKSKLTEYIKTKVIQDPDWAGLKKATKTMPDGSVVYAETGEVIDGVQAVRKDDTFEVKLI